MTDQERLQQGYEITERILNNLMTLHLLWIESDAPAAEVLARMETEVQNFIPEVSHKQVILRMFRRRIAKALGDAPYEQEWKP